jgi:hypothetical protein
MFDKEAIEFTKTMLMGLLSGCPYHRGNPEDCKLHEVRSLPEAERIEWASNLTEKECHDICSQHVLCIRGKKVV